MKKWIACAILATVLLGIAIMNIADGAMTNTVDSRPLRGWVGSGDPQRDTWWLFLQEIETYMEGTAALPGSPLLGDNTSLKFGTGTDFYGRWDGTNFDWLAAADDTAILYNGSTYRMDWWISSDADDTDRRVGFDASADSNSGAWHFGSDANGVDAVFYTRTAGDNFTWDASANTLTGTDVSVIMTDGDSVYFGTGSDGRIYSSSDNLYIDNDTTDKDIIFDVNDGGSDVTILTLDASANRILTGTATALNVADDSKIELGQTQDATIEYDEDGTNELRITGNTIFEDFVSNKVRTEVVTGADTLTAAQSGYYLIYTTPNTVTLPPAAAGLIFFIVDANATAAADLIIDPNGSDSINGDTAGHYIMNETDADGCMATLIGTAANTWYAIYTPSAWTEE